MTSLEAKSHRLGLLLVGLAALAWSSSGIFARSISADLMTMLFWRGLFSGAAVFTLFFIMEGRRALATLGRLRWPALGVAALSATGMITGIGSLRFTAVADAMVIYATVPFITAGMAYLFIGEKPSSSTLAASLVALVGVGIMLIGSGGSGGLFGKALALMMTCSMAAFTTLMRAHPGVPMLPAMGVSGWLASAFCWFFARPLSISAGDFGLTVLFGILQNAAGLAFYTFGSKRVPAAEATLIAALEVPFTPLWVWLFLSERPAPQTMIGGAVVLTALFGHIVMELRGRAPEDPQPFQSAP
jgi:drug/metabolite transporter (DMT)-like permease